MKNIALIAAIAGLSFMAPVESNASTLSAVLDDFNIDQAAGDLPIIGTVATTSTVGFGVGKTRTFTVKNVNVGSAFQPQTSLKASGGQLGFSNGSGASGWAKITYTGLGDIDLGPGGFFTFGISPGAFDSIANFTADVKDTDGHIGTYSEVLSPLFDPKLLFSAFTGTVDFNKVAELSFTIDSANIPGFGSQPSVDGTLDSISVGAVPVPAAGLMLVSALFGMASLRRKKSA